MNPGDLVTVYDPYCQSVSGLLGVIQGKWKLPNPYSFDFYVIVEGYHRALGYYAHELDPMDNIVRGYN